MLADTARVMGARAGERAAGCRVGAGCAVATAVCGHVAGSNQTNAAPATKVREMRGE
jgi:hypothetical protein